LSEQPLLRLGQPMQKCHHSRLWKPEFGEHSMQQGQNQQQQEPIRSQQVAHPVLTKPERQPHQRWRAEMAHQESLILRLERLKQ